VLITKPPSVEAVLFDESVAEVDAFPESAVGEDGGGEDGRAEEELAADDEL